MQAPIRSLDLHALDTPPTFVLSQDQTLNERLIFSEEKCKINVWVFWIGSTVLVTSLMWMHVHRSANTVYMFVSHNTEEGIVWTLLFSCWLNCKERVPSHSVKEKKRNLIAGKTHLYSSCGWVALFLVSHLGLEKVLICKFLFSAFASYRKTKVLSRANNSHISTGMGITSEN